MESQEVLERARVLENGVTTCSGEGLEVATNHAKGGENLRVDVFLEEMESYMDDINNRLTISRMVSDSIIKGIVNAFEQEAAEKIAGKELEMKNLKEAFFSRHRGSSKTTEFLPLLVESGEVFGFTDTCVEHDKIRESLQVLRNAAIERIKSVTELDGASFERILKNLERTMNTICRQMDAMLQLSKKSLCDWHRQQNLKAEIDTLVMRHSVKSLQEDFEEKLRDQKSCLCSSQSLDFLEKVDQISSLVQELESLLKLVPSSDAGMDKSHRRRRSDSLSLTTSFLEGEPKVGESKSVMPEHFNVAQLNHLSNEKLVDFFNIEISKIKRDHESALQQLTEKYMNLMGKYLTERQSVVPLTKDKDFDVLRKKITEVILKLDDALADSKKLAMFRENTESMYSLKSRLDILLTENQQLKASLEDKKNEVKFLRVQLSDASEKISEHSVTEANLQTLLGTLNSSIEDRDIESLITAEVYQCVIKCIAEESELELVLLRDIYGVILREATVSCKATSINAAGDGIIESSILQGLCKAVFVETVKDCEREFKKLYEEYISANRKKTSFEIIAVEEETKLRLEVEEKEKLKQELVLLGNSLEEKERLAKEMSAAFTRQNDLDKMDIESLNQRLKIAMEDFKETERSMVLTLTQEKQKYFSLLEVKEKEHRKQVDSVFSVVNTLSKCLVKLEASVVGTMSTNNFRLESSNSHLSFLIKEASKLRRTGLLCKQRLEMRCSDLQIAEAEVDLLGDQVDRLSSLLETIYKALDHYSPVLKHYPGVMEILKLVRRELTGEAIKLS